MEKADIESKEYLKKLGERIRKIRKEKHIKQVDLGYQIDVEKPNMARIEAGGNNLTVLTLRKIAAALEVDASELLKDL